jgi:1-acyl-sn-glycerol-3-phosphate acyltransferase
VSVPNTTDPDEQPRSGRRPAQHRRSLRERLVGGEVARTLLSIWWWLTFGIGIVLWLPMVAIVRVVTAPFDKGRYWAGFLFRKLPVVHQHINPLWTFKVSGKMPSDPRRPYIVVSNHESFVDILLISHLPFEMKWLSKVEMFKIPVVGWLMSLADDIRLSRGQVSSAADAMKQCADRLDKKVSVLIFAEGTRSTSGELGKFKNGAFRLAIETGCPILPVAVHGCHTALRPKDWRMGYSTAEVRVLEPIEVDGMTLKDMYALRDRTRNVIAAEIEVLRAELAS